MNMSNVPFFYRKQNSLFKEHREILIRRLWQSTGQRDGQCCCRVSLHLKEFECCSQEPLQSDSLANTNLTVRRKPFRVMRYHGPSLWIFHCILWTSCLDLLHRPASIQDKYNWCVCSSPSLNPPNDLWKKNGSNRILNDFRSLPF